MGKFIDLTGFKFERLFVIKRVESYIQPDGRPLIMWLCHCDCGTEKIISGKNLRNGTTKSCGCYNLENISKRSFINLVGRKFGKITVISRTDDYISPKGVYSTAWKCLCDCGNTKIIRACHLLNGFIFSCGCMKESNLAREIKSYCIEKFNALVEYKILKNPKTNRYLPYDIYLPEQNAFIEINGKQHYQNDYKFFKTEDEFRYNKMKDRLKRKFAKQHGIYIEIDLRKIKNIEKAIEKINKEIS